VAGRNLNAAAPSRRKTQPINPNPMIIIIHVLGSG
jgi:hypothetical protein